MGCKDGYTQLPCRTRKMHSGPPAFQSTTRLGNWSGWSGLRDPYSGHSVKRKPKPTPAKLSLGAGAENCLLPTGAIHRYSTLPSEYRLGSVKSLTRAALSFPNVLVPPVCTTRPPGSFGTRRNHAKPTGGDSGRRRGQSSPKQSVSIRQSGGDGGNRTRVRNSVPKTSTSLVAGLWL